MALYVSSRKGSKRYCNTFEKQPKLFNSVIKPETIEEGTSSKSYNKEQKIRVLGKSVSREDNVDLRVVWFSFHSTCLLYVTGITDAKNKTQ